MESSSSSSSSSQKGKLTRTPSSLLRSSSPTVRSPISSLSTVDEDCPDEEKPHKPHPSATPRGGGGGGAAATPPLLPLLLPLPIFLLLFFCLRDDNPFLQNLIFVSAGVAAESVAVRRARLLRPGARRSASVQWFIGDDGEKVKKGRPAVDDEKVLREGVEFYSNGDCYEGEFHKGKCNGSGVYNFFAAKGRYEGDWVDGKYDGYGVETWARGSRYRGQYRQGLRHGFGVYRFYNGDSYAGEWCSGQSHGTGVQSCSDGSCYTGEFKRGVKHGFGCYYFRNGDKYSGEYFADKIHGFGIYHFANSHCYEGSWHEGRRQGFGIYTFRTGETRSGDWDYGVLRTPMPPSDSAILRAVQGARKAAENAILVPRVEEQVNKAVAAANRASTASRVAAIKAVQNRMDGRFCDLDV